MSYGNGKQASLERAVKLFICNERLHRGAFEKKAADFSIHRSQHRMIMFLNKRNGSVSQKDLADEFEISSAAIAVACKKLETLGYISRVVSEEDNRINNLFLTQKGKALAEESKRAFDAVDAAMFAGFSTDELETFIGFLEKMQSNLKSM